MWSRIYSLVALSGVLVFVLITLAVQQCNLEKSPSGRAGEEASLQQQEPGQTANPDSKASALEDFLQQGWGLELGETRDEIVERLGPPLKEETRQVQNRHIPGQTDLIRRLEYEGLSLELYEVTAEGKQFLTELTIDSPKYPVKQGLSIGSPRQQVEELLGAPATTANQESIYESETGIPQSVSFTFENDRVAKIYWHFPVD